MNALTLDAAFLLPFAAWLAMLGVRDLRTTRRLATVALFGTTILTMVLGARHARVAIPIPWAHSGALLAIGPARVPFLLATSFTASALLAAAPGATLSVGSIRRTMLGFLAVCLSYLSTDFLLQAVSAIVIALVTYRDVASTAHTPRQRGEARLTGLLLGGSGLVSLVGAVYAVVHTHAGGEFDSFARDTTSHGQLLILAPIIASMVVRLAPFPLHGWLTSVLERGSLGAASMSLLSMPAAMMALHAMMPRAGAHGAGAPTWTLYATGVLIASGAFTAITAFAQHDLRRTVAHVTASQSALALAGLVTGTLEGGVAAVLFSLAVAITSVGLVFIAHSLETRAGTIDAHGRLGLAKDWPRIGAAFLLLALATIGFPGSVQFFAEDLLLQGLLEAHRYAAYSVLAVAVLNGITLLRLFIGLFFGPGHKRRGDEYVAPDFRLRELAGPAAMIGLMLALVAVIPTLGALIER